MESKYLLILFYVVMSSLVLLNFGEAFILRDILQPKSKQVRVASTFKPDVAEDRFFFLPELSPKFPFWTPHGYFNLCPFVKPLPYDAVWNAGCARLLPPPPPPLPPGSPPPLESAPEVQQDDNQNSDFIDENEDYNVNPSSDYYGYGYGY